MTIRFTNGVCSTYLTRRRGPNIYIGKRAYSAFRVCGFTGLVLAVLLAVSLVVYLGLSQIVMAGIMIAAVATFLVLAMVTKIVIGEEQLIYYHHEIAIMLVATMVLWLLNQPILPYLDITILAIGTFLMCGRIGCLMVGCCHGRPNHFGVCYGEEHAHAGFTPYYVGVRLFPIQAVESLWVLGTVLVGIAMVVLDYPPGSALAWYIITYDIGRFFFEFMRGDPTRHDWKGFSEGQWTSGLLMLVVVALELSGRVPYESWHLVTTGLLVLTMTGIALNRRLQKITKYQLTNPRHIRELAEAMRAVSGSATIQHHSSSGSEVSNNIPVRSTSLGILVSADQSTERVSELEHYALSCKDGKMTDEIARTVADIILTIKRSLRLKEFIKGEHGVYHLVLCRDPLATVGTRQAGPSTARAALTPGASC